MNVTWPSYCFNKAGDAIALKEDPVYRYDKLSRAELTRILVEAHNLLQVAEEDDPQRMLYDLHLHKVELEIQNQDLRDSRLALEEARDRYADLYDFSPAGYLTLDKKGIIQNLNLTAATMLGRERSRLLGKPLVSFLTPACHGALYEHLRRAFSNDDQTTGILELRCGREGTVREIRLDSRVQIDSQGGKSCLTILVDVSEQRRKEQALRETLIREVHHRIKNHLQGVMGLLNMCRRDDMEPDAIVDKTIRQVSTIATVYGLQSHTNENPVRLSDLLRACVDLYGYTSPIDANYLQMDDCRGYLAQENSVPIALVINELMSNAVKHRPETAADQPIQVKLSSDGNRYRLRIGNPSVGLPPDFDFGSGAGLGMGLELLRALLPTQGADLSLSQKDGMVYSELVLEPPVLWIDHPQGRQC